MRYLIYQSASQRAENGDGCVKKGCRVMVLTRRALSHLNGGDATRPQVTLHGQKGSLLHGNTMMVLKVKVVVLLCSRMWRLGSRHKQ